MKKWLLPFCLIPSLCWGAIAGVKDTLTIAGVTTVATYPYRTSFAGFIRANVIATADGRTAQRGFWSNVATVTRYAGAFWSTTTGDNDWDSADYVADVFWFPSIFDTLLTCCMGTAVLDTQYIDSITLSFTQTHLQGRMDTLVRGKIQGPYLERPRPPNAGASAAVFGTTGVDSSPCFNWFARNRPAASDTIFWRDSTVNAAPGLYDSANTLGDDFNDYELTITSGGNYTTKVDVGKVSQGNPTLLTGHANPVFFTLPTAASVRFSVNITDIGKAAVAACAANAASMRTEGFGVLINWVYQARTSGERIGKGGGSPAIANAYSRIAVNNSTAATSMALRFYFKTSIDTFCANKAMDAGNFKYPWYRRAGPVPGQLRGDRDSVKKPGIRRLRPPQ